MSHTFEQFVRFTTDAAGLERTFRLFQALSQILSSYTIPFNILLILLSHLPTSASPKGGANPATTHAVLLGLKSQLALARRYFRLFRFLESFNAAQKVYSSLSQSKDGKKEKGQVKGERENLALWLDVFGRTFNGMYLLLEASTIVDVQGIPGFVLLGPELERAVAVEGQRFWLFSLVCGVLAGLVRISDAMALASEPVAAKGGDEKKAGEGEKKAKTTPPKQVEQARAKIPALARRVVSDALDITLPGSVVGWVPAGSGTVGSAMLVTTVLTSMDIWERCGREVAGAKK
ncbi:peroxisomal biogenesis factor 11-domain-containing protein [Xylaria telfairii]|nr:peroxisomal biogenesis factor 11-domain-containing protein [Xylaria telfairii]